MGRAPTFSRKLEPDPAPGIISGVAVPVPVGEGAEDVVLVPGGGEEAAEWGAVAWVPDCPVKVDEVGTVVLGALRLRVFVLDVVVDMIIRSMWEARLSSESWRRRTLVRVSFPVPLGLVERASSAVRRGSG